MEKVHGSMTTTQFIGHYTNIGSNVSSVRFVTKIYIWSVCLEPMLFFALFPNTFYIGQNISRYLQLFVLMILFVNFALMSGKVVVNPFSARYKFYSYFILWSLISLIFGIFYGAYNIPGLPLEETMMISIYRPIMEHVITIYYFVYFVVIASYLIKNYADINYFFYLFSWFFYFSLIIGLLDLVLMMYFNGYGGIPKTIYNYDSGVGLRYHGITGEPRDAFVYLILGIGILWLKDIVNSKKNLTGVKLLLIAVAALLTQSTSGFIGVFFSSFLLLIYYIPSTSFDEKVKILFFNILIFGVIFFVSMNSIKVMNYYNSFVILYDTLYNAEVVTTTIRVAMNNIYPLWDRFIDILNMDFLPILIGTGLGSVSVNNNIYLMDNSVLNPHSNIVRVFYDTGLIGVVVLINAFIYPIRKMTIPKNMKKQIIFLMLIIIGVFFAHRSVAPFMFLGIIFVAVRLICQRNYYTLYHDCRC